MRTTAIAVPEVQHDYENADRAELRRRFEAALDLGMQVLHARQEQGMSQRELAKRSGVRQAGISRIERGTGNPTALTLQLLAQALDRRIELV